MTVVQVHVGMTDTAMADTNEHLGADRPRQFAHSFAERNAVVAKGLTDKLAHLLS